MDSSIDFSLLNDHDEANKDITLQQEAKGGWRSSIYIIGVEVAERFAYYGIACNLITYLTNVLNEPTATAAKNLNIWFGISTILPLLGAFIADSYVGRFRMIVISSLIYIVALIMLVVSVSVIPLRFQHVFFYISLYLVAVGQAGHKPCVQTFGADQFDENSPEEKKTKNSFFNWWFFGICSGVAAATFVIYLQDNTSWTVGFGIPVLVMTFGLFMFLYGKGSYRAEVQKGSPFVRILQVFVAACCKRHLSVLKDGYALCPGDGDAKKGQMTRTDQFKYLDKAMIIDKIDSQSEIRNNWRLCSMTQIEEAKILLRLVSIWFGCLMFAVTFAQNGTFFVKQGSSMDKSTIGQSFTIPPASLQVSSTLIIMLTIPAYDRVFVPIARKFTGHASGITMLQRIGTGMFLSIVAMLIAALVEARRVEIATVNGLLDKPNITVPMSICWLLPQFVISGIADVFTVVGLQQLFYDQMPIEMRSIGSAAYISVLGVGSLLSSVVIFAVQYVTSRAGEEWLGDNINRAHLDHFYLLLAGLSSLWLCFYIGASMRFQYKKVEDDDASIC